MIFKFNALGLGQRGSSDRRQLPTDRFFIVEILHESTPLKRVKVRPNGGATHPVVVVAISNIGRNAAGQ